MAFKATVSKGTNQGPFYYVANRSEGTKPYTKPLYYKLWSHTEKNGKRQFIPKGYENTYELGTFQTSMYQSINATVTNYLEYAYSPYRNHHNIVFNKALNKVAEELSYVENMFEAWYERKEAYTLLGQAGKGLLKFVTSWNKPSYWRSLFKGSKRLVKRPETLPEAWLLANFAIKPLVGTVDSCMNLLLGDMPSFWVEGSSGDKHSWSDKSGNLEMYYTTDYIVKHGVEVKSLNPNAQLLNIMGLTTPFSSFLNVVPWGWAVNYFVNINEVVSNFENRFPGVNIGSSYTTVYAKTTYVGRENTPGYWLNGQYYGNNPPTALFNGNIDYMKRTVGTSVPNYRLQVSFPSLGGSQFANLFSALALTMKGKAK